MRRVLALAVLFGLSRPVLASANDAHAEMAAALVAQATTHPGPASLPAITRAPQHAATRAAPARPALDRGQRAADAASQQARAQESAGELARQVQAAAMSAAGQAQGSAAKARANHPHPTPR
jgi:hypothetical protein